MHSESRRLETLSREECLRLLTTVSVGRLVHTVSGLPAVELVNFVVDRSRIVFRSTRSGTSPTVAGGTVVAFQVDELQPAARTGWSVTVVGEAWMLGGPGTTTNGNGTQDDLVAVDIGMVTGRRLSTEP